MDFSTYLSTFTWRYASEDMRHIFSEEYKYQLWRRIWVALAEVQHQAGLVSSAELADLKKHQNNIDIPRILAIEAETQHDVVAAIKEYAEKAKIGGGKIHLGATSMDITDNADMVRMHEALRLIVQRLTKSMHGLADRIVEYADLPTMGFTHLQPAEPTTVGYRLAVYGQDLLTDYHYLTNCLETLKAKGMKGAVGTRASYAAILHGTKLTADQLDQQVMEQLGITASVVSSQVYSRKSDYLALCGLASLGSSLAKFATDLRILQSPTFGEWAEPFGKKQVGSSAMPFKKNPLKAEKICSLARYLAAQPAVALENASHSYLERTLDDSANRRIILAETFLAADEMVLTFTKLIEGMTINPKRISQNLTAYAPFSAVESIIIEAVKKGADRQAMHELLREEAMTAWEAIQLGKPNPLPQTLLKNQLIARYLSKAELKQLMDVSHHIGDAPRRAKLIAKKIKQLP